MIEFKVCLPEYTKEQQKLEKGSGGRNGKTNTFFLVQYEYFPLSFLFHLHILVKICLSFVTLCNCFSFEWFYFFTCSYNISLYVYI